MLIVVIYILALTSSVFGGKIDEKPDSIEEGFLGEPKVLKWKLTLEGNEKSVSLTVCLDSAGKNCIADGTLNTFGLRQNTAYDGRIETKFDDPFHVLTITKLNQTDNGLKIYAFVKFLVGVDGDLQSLPVTEISVVEKKSNDGSGTSAGTIAGIVVGVIAFIVIVAVVIFLVMRWKKNNPSKTSGSEPMSALRNSNQYEDRPQYAATSDVIPPQKQQQQTYAPLGIGGGRSGPKDEPIRSNYAQVKTDDMGYPATGPTSGPLKPVRGQTKMQDQNDGDNDGFNSGVIV